MGVEEVRQNGCSCSCICQRIMRVGERNPVTLGDIGQSV